MSHEVPTLTISPEARRLVSELHYDGDLYTDYLVARDMPEEEIANLELHLDDKFMSFGSHGVYMTRAIDDPDSRHVIGFSPTRMPRCTSKQGSVFRHETEHFIYQVEHPNHLRNRKRLVIGSMALGACMGAALGMQTSMKITKNLPLAAGIPIDVVAAFGLTGVGALSGLFPSAMAHIAIGPSELRAIWASRRRRTELPNGVLQIQFK